ncbi:MAG TPA: hypothetical protein VFD36_08510, partial [Kofleriaceae bacterium]|nr:hypothetical protein [Kofleriaceae bacterium]
MLALASGLACGPRPPPSEPSWIERDVNEPAHATPPPRSAAQAVDPARLERIDELDEPALRAALDALGDRAPAGKLALRASRSSPRWWASRAARSASLPAGARSPSASSAARSAGSSSSSIL